MCALGADEFKSALWVVGRAVVTPLPTPHLRSRMAREASAFGVMESYPTPRSNIRSFMASMITKVLPGKQVVHISSQMTLAISIPVIL